ncbi:dual specificity protein kinase monopolar spindle 1 [Choristoneura fumiferana]|uniref:dual specificity protein kinase monopolar spindle 1 n=1 Tax=Choristoneura fumiferana TaxID=7141 RepID=UPI003D15C6BF
MSCKSNSASKLTKYQPMPMKTLLANIQALPADLNKPDSSDSSDDSCGTLVSKTKKVQPMLSKKANTPRDRSYFDRVHVMPTIEASTSTSIAVNVDNVPARPPLLEKKESNRCLFPEPVKEQAPKETPKIKQTNTSSKTDLCPPSTPFTAQTPTVSTTATTVAATPSQPQTRTSKVQYKSINIKGKKYMYIRRLGSGGSSTVYKMLEITTSNEFALKSVNLTSDREVSQGYLNEVKVLRDLQSSDRVVKLYEYDHVKSANTLNLLLEVGETDLASFLRKHREGAPPALVLHYWEEMLRAVQQIHSHGIVHADLKPANFLLVSGTLKLIDFGIASKVSSDATSVERSCGRGTFSYISPEALGGDGSQPIKVSFYSDIWSLGCILYSLIYGHTPFAHLANMVKIVAIQDPNHRISYPRVDHLPASLLAVLKQCLRYNGHSRPTVTELLQMNHITQELPSIPDDILHKIQVHLTPREFSILKSAKVTPEALAYAET